MMVMLFILLIFAAVQGGSPESIPHRADSAPENGPLAEAMVSMETFGGIRIAGDTLPFRRDMADFYRNRGYAMAWLAHGLPGKQARQVSDVVAESRLDGLDPGDYHAAALDSLLRLFSRKMFRRVYVDRKADLELELLLTHAFLKLGADLLSGSRPWIEPDRWPLTAESWDLSRYLETLLAGGLDMGEGLQRLAPPAPEYAIMKGWLAEYSRRKLLGGWPLVPEGPILGPGSEGERVVSLCLRLQASGDMVGQACVDSFSISMQQGLGRFQARHGLKSTGVLDPPSLTQLNVPVEERLNQMRLNLEYWRWLPRNLGERHVRINLADFSLGAFEAGQAVLTMKVVIGRKEDRTPVFSDRMVAVVLNPAWNVPGSIAREELLPELQKDPEFLSRHEMDLLSDASDSAFLLRSDSVDWSAVSRETFRFRVRQRPGAQNALGRVKFVLTNPYQIYLHDTPSIRYFQRSDRALSHGCVRLEKPLELASWALGPASGWDADNLSKEIGKEKVKTLPIPGGGIPVHILYWTAFVDKQGVLHFRRDIYGLDRIIGQGAKLADEWKGM